MNSKQTFLILLLLVLIFPSNVAYGSDSGVVIYQVYGAGGNSGAPYDSDFVVLFNASNSPVNITNWSIQYTSATGTGFFSSNVTVLDGITLQAGQYYLVQFRTGSNGVALPTPDLTDNTSMSATSGKVVLVSDSVGLTCNGSTTPCSSEQLAKIVDLVGYGSANFYEGSGPTPILSATTAAIRKNGGCTDTDDNSADFDAGPVSPKNSSSAFNACGPLVVSSITRYDPNPTMAANVDYSVTFTKPVTGVDATDFTLTTTEVTGASVTTVTGSGADYTVSVNTGSGSGTLRLDLSDDDSIIDAASNPLGGPGVSNGDYINGETYTIDKTSPAVTIEQAPSQPDPTNNDPILFTTTFSEPIDSSSFTSDDVNISGSTGASTAIITETAPNNGTTFQISISGMTGSGTVTVSISPGGIEDLAGNTNVASTSVDNSVTYDTVPPTVTVEQSTSQSDPTNNSTILFIATFSESINSSTFTSDDLAISGTAGGTTANILQIAPLDNTTFEISISGMTNSGMVIVSMAENSAQDPAGNLNAASTSADNSVTYDITSPVVSSIQRGNASPANSNTLDFSVTFSKPVTDVILSDFEIVTSGVSGATLASISGSDDTYCIRINTGTGNGTLQLDLNDDDSIQDLLGNFLGGTGLGNGNFNSGESYLIDRSIPPNTGGMIVNNISNGSSGNKEWIELVVVGPDETVDLSGWIIDDNNGDFDSLSAGKGIASGHLRFSTSMPNCSTGQSLATAPTGARIIIYNADDVEAPLDAFPNDPCDTDGDGVYYLPVGTTNNTLYLEQCAGRPNVNPTTASACYYGCSCSSPAVTWSELLLANIGDAIQVRQPNGLFFHGFAYGNLTTPPAPNFPVGNPSFNIAAGSGVNMAYQFGCGN